LVEAVLSEIRGHEWPHLDAPEATSSNLEPTPQVVAIPDGSQKKSPEGQGEPSGPVESRPGEGPGFLGSTQGGE
jgi:hypothetical protein